MTKFLTPLMLYVLILYMNNRTYNLKSTPSDRFLNNFSWQFFDLLSEFLLVISWEEVDEEIFYIFHFVVDVRPRDCPVQSCVISQHSTYSPTATSKFLFNKQSFMPAESILRLIRKVRSDQIVPVN